MSRGRAGRWLRRLLGVGVGLAAGVAAGLTLGAVEVDEPVRHAAITESGPAPPEAVGRRSRDERRDPVPAAATVSLRGGEALPVKLEGPPASGVVFDLETGASLWQRDPRAERPIASLTKVMTALIVVDELERPGRLVPIRADAAGAAASGGVTGSAIGLEQGMRVKVGALLQAMLISSHNDAATALAVHAAGSEDEFVERMNRRAGRLGLDCTRFVSPHGFEAGNRSCAADVAAMTRLAMEERRVRQVVRHEQAVIDFPIDGGKRYLHTTNPLLEDDYHGTIGLKTGFTEQAGHSLAAVVRRGGRTLGVVLLDSPDPAAQAERLLNVAFARRTPAPGTQPLGAAGSRAAVASPGGSPESSAGSGLSAPPSDAGAGSRSPRK